MTLTDDLGLPDDELLAAGAVEEGLVALAEDRRKDAEYFLLQALRYRAPRHVARARIALARMRMAPPADERTNASLREANNAASIALLREADKAALVLEDGELLLDLASAWQQAEHPTCAARACNRVLTLVGANAESEDVAMKPAVLDGNQRFLAAQAHMRLAFVATSRRRDPERHYEAAAALGSWHVSPFALIELAVLRSKRPGTSKEVDWALRDALEWDHPIASPEAGCELAGLLTARGLVDDARTLLEGARDECTDPHSSERAAKAVAGLPDRFYIRAELPDVSAGSWGSEVSVPRRVLIAGGGTGGRYCVEDLADDPTAAGRYELVGFVDDDPTLGELAPGVRRLGALKDIPTIASEHQPHEIWITMPRVAPKAKRQVALDGASAAVVVKTVPFLREVGGRIPLHRQLRLIAIADVVGDRPADVDLDAGAWLRTSRPLIIGCGTVGTQIALSAARAGSSSIALLDRRDTALHDLRHRLDRVHGVPQVVTKQASSVDADEIATLARDHRCDVIFYTASGWGRSEWDRSRKERVIDGLHGLVSALPTLPDLERFVLLTPEPPTWVATPGQALDAVCEALLLSPGEDGDDVVRCAVHMPAVYTSTRSVIADLERDVERGLEVRVPPPAVTCRFEHAYRVVDLALRAARTAQSGDVYSIAEGDEVSVWQLAEWMLELKGRTDEVIEDPMMEIGDPPRPVGDPTDIDGLVRVAGPCMSESSRDHLHRLARGDEEALVDEARQLRAERPLDDSAFSGTAPLTP